MLGRDVKHFFALSYLIILGIISPSFLRSYGDNILVITLLISVILYVVFLLWFKPGSSNIYPLALFVISLSILICFNARSNHLFGNDIHLEYYEFRLTDRSGNWIPDSLYSSCLSITILPTILSSVSGLDGEFIFKFVYLFVLSLVPVVLYQIYRKWIGDAVSFSMALFFIASTIYFLQMPSLTRQIVATLLFVLAIGLLMKSEPLKSKADKALFVVLSFGIITAHYSTGMIFIGVLFLFICYSYLSRLIGNSRKKTLKKSISRVPLPLFLVDAGLGLIWYGVICKIPLEYATNSIITTLNQLSDFWVLGSRPTYALQLIGLVPRQGLPDIIGFLIGNVIRGTILLGLLAFWLLKGSWKDFRIDNDYAAIGTVAIGIVGSFIILPYIANAYNVDRLYLTFLIFQLPFIAVGGYLLSLPIQKLGLRKEKAFTLIMTILIASQLFYSIGLLHQATGYQSFTVLNTFQDAAKFGALSPDCRYYVFDQDVAATLWLVKYQGDQTPGIVADHVGKLILSSYGLIPYDSDTLLTNDSSNYLKLAGTYFFLRGENVLYDRIWIGTYTSIPNVTSSLMNQNLIYNSGVSQTYVITP